MREAISMVGELEDRSLSKIAEYLMWAGFERFCAEKRLLSAFEIKRLNDNYKAMAQDAFSGEENQDKKIMLPVTSPANLVYEKKKKRTGEK